MQKIATENSLRKQITFKDSRDAPILLCCCNRRTSIRSKFHARFKSDGVLILLSFTNTSVLLERLVLLFVLHHHISLDARLFFGLRECLRRSRPKNVFKIFLLSLRSVPAPHSDFLARYSKHLRIKSCLLNRPLFWIALEAVLKKLFFFEG